MSAKILGSKEDSQLVEAASAELAAVRELTFEMDSTLYTDPAPGVRSVAKILLEVGEVRAHLACLASLLEEPQA